MVSRATIGIFLLYMLSPILSQEPSLESIFPARADEQASDIDQVQEEAEEVQQELVLPLGFGNILLGQAIATVQEALIRSPFFFYRGEPDVSFRPFNEEPVITIGESPFSRSSQFQFSDGLLSVIILSLDMQRVDYFSMFQLFTQRYGEASEVNPNFIMWENSEVMLRLEKPLTVKYIAKEMLQALLETVPVLPTDPEREYFFEQF